MRQEALSDRKPETKQEWYGLGQLSQALALSVEGGTNFVKGIKHRIFAI